VLSMESLLPEPVVAELDTRFGPRFRALPEAGRSALVTAAAEGRISNRRLQQVLEQHPRDLTALLGDLVRGGFLEPHGERAGRWYTLGGSESVSDRDRSGPSSDRSSMESPLSSDGSSPDFSQSSAESQDQLLDRVRASPWALAHDLEAALVVLCRDHDRTLPQLAAALGRKPATLRPRLKALVGRGELELRHPDRPTHPDQAYRAARQETDRP